MLAWHEMVSFIFMTLLAAAPGAGGGKNVAALLEQGQKLYQAGDLEGALQVFEKAGKAEAKDPRPPYLRGVVLEKKNDPAGAEKAYREAIARDAKFASARNNLGAILLGRNELAGAEKELLAATQSDPKNARAAFNLGLLREAQNRPREAAASYRRSLQVNPDDGTCHANLCAVLRRMGDLDPAISECRQAVRIMPGNAIALTNLGLLLSDKGRFDEARENLLKATQADAAFAPAWTGLGRVELRRKDVAAALLALAKAVKLDPKDARTAADYCRALAEKDMRAKPAEEACRKAIALDAESGLGHYELLKILVARGDCAGAKKVEAKFAGLASVKAKAKAQADEIVKTCVAGKAARPPADSKGGGKKGK